MPLTIRLALKRAGSPANKTVPDKSERKADRSRLDTLRRNGSATKELILDVKEWTGWLLLAPLCLFSCVTFTELLLRAARDGGFWGSVELRWFAHGAVAWLALFGLWRRSLMIVYVFAHELTHVITAKAFGAVVYDWHFGHDGGWVDTSKSNTAISLSPYLVPLYTVAVLVTFGVLGLFLQLDHTYLIPVGSVDIPFHGWKALCFLIGLTWCLHFTYTVQTLRTEQSDLMRNGSFFSGWLIVLGNMAIVAALLIACSPSVTWLDAWHTMSNTIGWTLGLLTTVATSVAGNVWGAISEIVSLLRGWKLD